MGTVYAVNLFSGRSCPGILQSGRRAPSCGHKRCKQQSRQGCTDFHTRAMYREDDKVLESSLLIVIYSGQVEIRIRPILSGMIKIDVLQPGYH